MSQFQFTGDGTTAALTYLRGQVAGLESYDDPGLEAFNITTRMADVFLRAVYSFRTNVLNRFKDFRRSELRAYNEAHSASLRLMFSKPHLNLQGVMVPIPDGMRVPYLEATNGVTDILVQINIDEVLKTLTAYLDKLAHTSDYDVLTPETARAAKQISNVTKEGVSGRLKQIFVDGINAHDVPVDHVLPSGREIQEVNTKILGFEKHFLAAAQSVRRFQEIERKIDAVVRNLREAKEVDIGYVKALHSLVSTAAVQLDMYGAILHEMQRIEHVFTLALDNIVVGERRNS